MKKTLKLLIALATTVTLALTLTGCFSGGLSKILGSAKEILKAPHVTDVNVNSNTRDGETTATIKITLDSNDPEVVAYAVDTALKVVWNDMSIEPEAIRIEAFYTDSGKFDDYSTNIDLYPVAQIMGLYPDNVHDVYIILDKFELTARYGNFE